jgi:DNA-binding LacI/PurR family transcriptional regulator
VPGDISVTGFDNIALAEYVTPTLTTVDIPRDEIGRAAVAGLIATRRRNGARAQEVVITPRLVLRESTAGVGKTSAR